MKALIQRVLDASLKVEGKLISEIKQGLVILLGIHEEDTKEDLDWLARKVAQLRVFSDDKANMNLSLQDIDGEALVVSQFTLYANTKKGNRPSFTYTAKPEKAILFCESFVEELQLKLNKEVHTGIFGADMKVALTNDGPVTIMIDSKNKM